MTDKPSLTCEDCGAWKGHLDHALPANENYHKFRPRVEPSVSEPARPMWCFMCREYYDDSREKCPDCGAKLVDTSPVIAPQPNAVNDADIRRENAEIAERYGLDINNLPPLPEGKSPEIAPQPTPEPLRAVVLELLTEMDYLERTGGWCVPSTAVIEKLREAMSSTFCPRCEGTGKYARLPGADKPCAVCDGTGQITEPEGEHMTVKQCPGCGIEHPAAINQSCPFLNEGDWQPCAGCGSAELVNNQCANHQVYRRVEPEAAPQGVGKLSPEPGPDCGHAVELHAPSGICGLGVCQCERVQHGLNTMAVGEAHLPQPGRNAQQNASATLDAAPNPKGVEGVGQTARELDALNQAFKALYLEVDRRIVDDLRQRFNDYLSQQLRLQHAESSRETLTLRAELQQAQASNYANRKRADAAEGDAERLRSRLHEADALLADCRTYFAMIVRGGWTDVSLIMAKLNKWMEDSNAPRR